MPPLAAGAALASPSTPMGRPDIPDSGPETASALGLATFVVATVGRIRGGGLSAARRARAAWRVRSSGEGCVTVAAPAEDARSVVVEGGEPKSWW